MGERIGRIGQIDTDFFVFCSDIELKLPQKSVRIRPIRPIQPNLNTRVARLAFAELLELEWNPLQLQFIELVIDYFGQRGALEIKMLFKPPFTDLYSGNMRHLFDAPIFERIKKTIERVNADLK